MASEAAGTCVVLPITTPISWKLEGAGTLCAPWACHTNAGQPTLAPEVPAILPKSELALLESCQLGLSCPN